MIALGRIEGLGEEATTAPNAASSLDLPEADGPIIVKVRYFVIGVREIDSARQAFEADIFWRLRWHDPQLHATQATSGIRRLPLSEIWHPDLNAWNSSDVETTYDRAAEIDPDGNVTYRQRVSGRFDSQFNLRDFPFDRQNLLIQVVSGRYRADQVKFVEDEEPSGVADGLELPEWLVSPPELKVAPLQLHMVGTSLASFAVEIPVKRDSAFYVRKMLVPLFLILAMAYAVLWIEPGQLGPQIGVCTGAIFSFIAFRFSLSVLLPRISYFTRMDEFVFGATLLVFLPLGKAIISSRLVKAERMVLVHRLDQWSRWLYPAGVIALAWFTLGS